MHVALQQSLLMGGGEAPDVATVTPWSDMSVAFPTTSTTNEDRVVSFTLVTPRTFSFTYSGGNTLEYRKNSGSYVSVGTPVSLNGSSDTLGFKYTGLGNEGPLSVSVIDNTTGLTLDTFPVEATLFP